MKTVAFIGIYFFLLIVVFKLSDLIANKAILRGFSLEEIKFIVWFYLYSFIIGISVIIIVLISYQFNMVGFSLLLASIVVTVIIMIISLIYIILKFI